jgi:hypothetical protein
VHYTITLTTYDLRGQVPVCDESVDTCSINSPNRRRCILVQAISESGGHTSDEIVSVEVTGTRCWSFLMFYSSVPFIFFLLRFVCQQRSSSGNSYHPVDRSEEPNPPPTAPEIFEPIRPPPTAPHSESEPLPSAPPEARLVEPEANSDIIVIPAENVISVPPYEYR